MNCGFLVLSKMVNNTLGTYMCSLSSNNHKQCDATDNTELSQGPWSYLVMNYAGSYPERKTPCRLNILEISIIDYSVLSTSSRLDQLEAKKNIHQIRCRYYKQLENGPMNDNLFIDFHYSFNIRLLKITTSQWTCITVSEDL